MNVRGIELVEKDSGKVVSPEYLIGVDETGNHNESGPFSIVAVLCPRAVEPKLAEMMVDAGMKLWKEKPCEELFAESNISEFIEQHPEISWFAIGSTAPISREQKAAAAIIAAMYTLIQPNVSWSYSVDEAALVHDGNDQMYGKRQRQLRQQAFASIDSEFIDRFGEIFLTQTSRGDQIYPTVMLADVISGQICDQISRGKGDLESISYYEWFRSTWVGHSKGNACPLYYLRNSGSLYPDYLWENYAAWLTGKSSASHESQNSSISIDTLIRKSDSDVITDYLREYRN